MKPAIKFSIILICILTPIQNLESQNFYYSQYENTPLDINPAVISGENMKLSLFYHQNDFLRDLQMRNLQMSFIYPVNFLKTNKSIQGVGLMIDHDNTGRLGLMSCTNASLAFAQGIKINRWSSLSAGLQASFLFYSNNNHEIYTTGNQWVEGFGFDPSLGINEDINTENVNLFSLGTGLNWNIHKGNVTKGQLGFSIYDVNKPVLSFLGRENELNPRYIVHSNYTVFKKQNISITPRALFIYQNVNLVSLGTLIKYSFTSRNPFLLIQNCDLQLGLDYRHDHSGIVNFAFEQKKYLLGFSYAFSIKPKDVFSGYNSNFEMCMVIKFNSDKKRSQITTTYNIGETRLVFDDKIDQKNQDQMEYSNFKFDTVTITGEKYSLQLREYFKFNFNEARLNKEAMIYLDELAKMLKQNPSLKIEVIGHTDDVGTEDANQKISEQRAQTVIDYLVSKGIKSSRLKLTAKGKTEPLVPNNTEENRSKNRRVEFIIYSE